MTENDDSLDADGWTPSPDARPVAERHDIDDLGILGEVTHEIRGAMLRRLRDPRSVAELAAGMDVPVTRLHHHVNRLLDLGLIQVVATRQVAAVTERRYQITAKTYGFEPARLDELDHHQLATALGGLFDVAKLGFQRMVEAGGLRHLDDEGDGMGTMSLGERYLSPERHRELVRRLDELLAEFESDRDQDDPEAVASTVFVAAYPELR